MAKILITAGPTRESIDPVRFITNHSSGKMGYEIAAAAAEAGHDVVLVSGPVNLDCPEGVRRIFVTSAQEMLDACLAEFSNSDAAIMVAAVADYRPKDVRDTKISKSEPLASIELERTGDIARTLGAQKQQQLLVGFALETHQGRSSAHRKLTDKNLDAIVLNGPESFGNETIRAEFLEAERDWREFDPMSKRELARFLVEWINARLSSQETADA